MGSYTQIEKSADVNSWKMKREHDNNKPTTTKHKEQADNQQHKQAEQETTGPAASPTASPAAEQNNKLEFTAPTRLPKTTNILKR